MRTKTRVALIAAALIPCLVFAYGFIEPSSAAGHFTFHTFYLFPPTRPAFLQLYSRILPGGTIPVAIDEFLACRLAQPQDREWRGILAFYLAQTPSRWGGACGRLHESFKPAIVGHLLVTIDSDPPRTQVEKLIFIEYLRLDGRLYKGEFSQGDVVRWDAEQGQAIYNPAKIQQAIAAFRKWYASADSWLDIRMTNPLEGTDMAISGIP